MFRILAGIVAISTLNFVLKYCFEIRDQTRDMILLVSVVVFGLAFVTGPVLKIRDRLLSIGHFGTTGICIASPFLADLPVILRRSGDLFILLGIAFTLCRGLMLITQAERRLLDRLSERTSGRYADQFLTSLSEALVQSLGLHYAFVSEIVARDDAREVVIATAASNEKKAVSISSPMVGGAVDMALFESTKRGPTTVLPLTNHRSEETGHLVLLHARSKELTEGQRAVLNAYASRAAAEVERKHADEEKQQLEMKILQGQKLESLGLLAGGIAHDFNNLLAGMRNHAALARSMVSEESGVAANVGVIELAVDQGSQMCERLLAYAGQSPRENAVFDLGKVVLDTVSIVEATNAGIPPAKIRFCDQPMWIWGDASQLSQVILNLLTNAIDASSPGSKQIEVITEIVNGGQQDRANTSVLLKVIDHGKGISRDALPKIFDPFYSTKEQGRGLGLASVAGVVKDHHGEFSVESEIGVGTCFSISIPLTDRRPKVCVENAMECDSTVFASHTLVLVVDDNELVRWSTAALLKCSGFEVMSVASGGEAIEAFDKYKDAIGVVLLDQTMPVMNGLDTYKAMCERGCKADFVFMSGHSTLTFDDDLFEEVRFIRKPFATEQLLAVLSESEAFANID